VPLASASSRTRTSHFDAARDLHYLKPAMRGWSHLVWFGLCLVAGPWVLVGHLGNATRVIALTIYVTAIAGLFGTSAFYHCGTWSVVAARRWQRLDHVMILFMIAGTATPAFLLTRLGLLGLIATIAIWTLTIGVATIHLRRMQVPERLIGAAFLILGWTGVLVIPAIWIEFGATAALLILVGGLLYTVGAICYHRRRPDPIPAVFGYHEVFHALVCAAATMQFIAISVYIA
jgi:hemolysin III